MSSYNPNDVVKSRESKSDLYLGRLKSVHGHYDRTKVERAIIDIDGDFDFKTPFPINKKREPKRNFSNYFNRLSNDRVSTKGLYTKPTYIESIILRDDSECIYCVSNTGLMAIPLIFLQHAKRYDIRREQLTNPGNLVTSCRSCINKRHLRLHEKFLEEYPEFVKNFSTRARYVPQIIREKLRLDELLKKI